jgi:hypothetical protein
MQHDTIIREKRRHQVVRSWHDLADQTRANERQVTTFPVNNLHNCNVRFRGTAESAWMAGIGRERLVRYGMKKTRIADIWLRNRLRGKKPSKSEEKVEPDRCF